MEALKYNAPKERGYRLDIAIRLTRNNLDGFAKKYGFSRSSLFAWRRGAAPLTEKAARKICDALLKAGYLCKVEWLMEGTGNFPLPKEELQPKIASLLNKEIDYSDNLNTREKILVEVNVFERLYQNSLVVNIIGDSMEPFYAEGDYVGGLALEKDEYQKALNKNCIVVLRDIKPLVRYVSAGERGGRFNLSPANTHTKDDTTFLYDIYPDEIYPILWHRKFNL